MSEADLVSNSEYLAATFYRPDRKLIDGRLIERELGEYDHSNLHGALIIWLGCRQRIWNIRILPGQRLRISANRFRIPDVCVIPRDQQIEPVFTRPPLICIEILSKDDTLRSMQARIDDYLAFGVPSIWILDPVAQRAYVCSRKGLTEPDDKVLRASGSSVEISLPELFQQLE
jgi:Uma2 family endonuclease